MSKTEFIDPLEAEKFKKQKCVQFSGTPCRMVNILDMGNIHKKLSPFSPIQSVSMSK